MTRAFRPDPVAPELVDHLVDLASRAPSAGKAQGWHLLVLEGEQTARFWDLTLPIERRSAFAWPELLTAPVIALPLADPDAYVERYAEPDKAHTGLGVGTDAWPVPYWTIDASMSLMTLLLGADAAGLGSLLFGVFTGEAQVRQTLGIPEHLVLLGAVALGYPSEQDGSRRGRSATRTRRPPSSIVHRGHWTAGS